MKPGDLVQFAFQESIASVTATVIGIFLNIRTSKWCGEYAFYDILTHSGVKEYCLTPDSIEVLNDAKKR